MISFFVFLKSRHFLWILLSICSLGIIWNFVPVLFYFQSANEITSLEPHVIFDKLDLNRDGKLNLTEFLSYSKYFTISLKEPDDDTEYEVSSFAEALIEPGYEPITIKAYFQPLDLNSMSKEVKSILHGDIGSLQGLIDWKEPYKETHTFSAKDFSLFLPQVKQKLVPGLTWKMIEPKQMSHSSSLRYFPPKVESKFRPLFALLSMFHPHLFLWTRFGPQGSVAVLRAIKDNFLDIFFRIHAEFQLNQPPLHPFWFTPAQFQGRIIISKNSSSIKYFHLEVPSDRKLNVDMEWLNGPTEDEMEVDIGYVPQMTLSSIDPKTLEPTDAKLLRQFSDNPSNDSISIQQAITTMKKTLYPFQRVQYHNLSDAFHVAKHDSKLVHGIVLWGALDDQSC